MAHVIYVESRDNKRRGSTAIVRRVRFESGNQARLLTFSCDQHRPLLTAEWARDMVVDQLALTHDRLGFLLYAWCVMPDHVHLLILPDPGVAEVPRILMAFKGRSSERILSRMRKSGAAPQKLWHAGGGHDRNLTDHTGFLAAVDYVEDNPVVAGLCARKQDYRWFSAGCSFLGGICGERLLSG